MAESLPAWLEGLTHKDFLFNGTKCSPEMWTELDWTRAYMDMGPSPAGNVGPYWHVPRPSDDTRHRLYPKVLRSKWLLLIRRAVEEAVAAKPRAPEPRTLSAGILEIFGACHGLQLNRAAVMAALPYQTATTKQVSNALDYLTRTGRLTRSAPGRYGLAQWLSAAP